MKKKVSFLLILFLFVFVQACASHNDTPFIRIDRDDPEAWKGELDNLRLLTGNMYDVRVKSHHPWQACLPVGE